LGYIMTNAYFGDSTQLLYLRARQYAPGIGRFLTRDIFDEDRWGYANNNPINYTDPSGNKPRPPVTYWGPQQFVECFTYHTGLAGNVPFLSAGEAVEICKRGFRKDLWHGVSFNLNTNELPKSAGDLFGRYLFESYGQDSNWLKFNANEPLTRELAVGTLVNDIRNWYYQGGDKGGHTTPSYKGGNTSYPILYNFGIWEYIGSMYFDTGSSISKASLPLEFVMGSFNFQVVKVGSDRLGFRIDNDMTIESGTHIVGRKPGEYSGSVEDLIRDNPYLAAMPLSSVINKEYNGYKVISILSSQTINNTTGNNGGGSLFQTFTWTERYDPCLSGRMPQQVILPILDIQIWNNYSKFTSNPGPPFPGGGK
jgi:RHS repeat-associated protein